jgi:putative chitinase
MWLSPHFTLAEFEDSFTARYWKIDNKAPPEIIGRLRVVAAGLERIRAAAGCPLALTSGWRGARLNRLVGGVRRSAHTLGWAADVRPVGRTLEAFVAQLRATSPQVLGRYDQLIVETSRGVLHASFSPSMRMQWLVQSGGPKSAVLMLPTLDEG